MIVVEGRGPKSARLMIVGEKPGEWEAQTGVAFHPRAAVGKELTRYLHHTLRLDRDDVYMTNLVPEYLEDRDITRADIKRWENTLIKDIDEVHPDVIMTLGREATRWFLGNVSMEQVYGLPHAFKPTISDDSWTVSVVPNYLRLYDPDLQPVIWYGFDQCRRVLAGELSCHKRDTGRGFWYTEGTTAEHVAWLRGNYTIAVDTEGLHLNPWGLSASVRPRMAMVVRKGAQEALAEFQDWLPYARVILHNSLHDLAVLRDLGIHLKRFDDTMVMAFMLCLEPQGLKDLAYRYRGIERESYLEVIGPASKKLALDWLNEVALQDWGPAPEELVFEGDKVKIRKPWSLNRRIDGVLGVREGEILTAGDTDKKSMTAAKKVLEKLGVRVGKYNPTRNGWINCRVSTHAYTTLQTHPGYLYDFPTPDAVADPRSRWETLEKDMPEQTDALQAKVGAMPEAGLDALEQVFGEEGAKKAIDYSAGDADDTMTIYPILKKRIDEMGLTAAYELDVAVIPMIDRMMHIGFGADKEYFQQLGRELKIEMERDLDEIQTLIGARINPNSSLQVASLLFDKMKLPVQQYTETKQPSTADEVIEALRLISDDPVLPLISDYRELSKMKGTYADKLWRWLGPDGRIHPLLRITRVPSGRLSCSEPNLMAIPVRSQRLLNGVKLGKAIRAGFVPRPGCVLGSWDLDQIEMRVLADRSQDPTLIQVFLTGEDIHQKTASLVFSLPMSEVAKGTWQRDSAKNCGFGIVYGITAKGLQLQLKLRGIDRSEEECQAMIDAYLVVAYPGVRSLMEDKKAEARRYGYVRTMLGRLRYLPGIHSSNNKLRSEAERVCLNHDIQGTAQELIKLAMKGIWERVLPEVWRQGYYCEPILQIHDEILMEMDERVAAEVDVMVRNEMQEATKLCIPIGAKCATAHNWGELK